jgi:hypothetical protein
MNEPLVVYRGQKQWDSTMDITAPTMRRAHKSLKPEAWTDQLLDLYDGLIADTAAGNEHAKSQLERQLLVSQQAAYQNPFVSCSYFWSIAQSFALFRDTPGYVLTIECEAGCDGVDFEDLRVTHNLYSGGLDYLREYGLPKRTKTPFEVTVVDLVQPFGQPTVNVKPRKSS